MKLNKSQRKKLTFLRMNLKRLEQQLSGSKKQNDSTCVVNELESKIKIVQSAIDKIVSQQ